MRRIFIHSKRIFLFTVAAIAVIVLINGCKGKATYEGYKVLDSRFVDEVNAECVYLEHIKSGAKVLKIKADDPNKLFVIGFKTIPKSDC